MNRIKGSALYSKFLTKQLLCGCACVFLFASTVIAQDAMDKNEKIAAMKVAFITRKLNLSPKEAQQFWPVYNQYDEELNKLRMTHRKMVRDAKEDFTLLSESELEKLIDEQINFRQKEVDVIKKYHPEFKKVLPLRKVAMLYKAEEDFKRHLLKQIKSNNN